MKRTNIILFALMMLLSVGTLWAQEQKPYRPAATFKGDTARYLEYNYTIRSAQYIGKTAGDILKELEYPVIYVDAVCLRNFEERTSKVSSLTLGIRQIGKNSNPMKDYYIELRFVNPPDFGAFMKASGYSKDNYPPAFSQKVYDFIKDLKISDVFSNQFIFKDPDLVKAQKQAMERENEKGRRALEEVERIKQSRKQNQNGQ